MANLNTKVFEYDMHCEYMNKYLLSIKKSTNVLKSYVYQNMRIV